MAKTIRQTCTLPASPREVYDALMDSRKHRAFSGEPASISKRVGGTFTAYGDYISGKNLDLVANRKIVQSWHASDWPEGHFSRVTYSLKPVKGGTRLRFIQSGVPDNQYRSLKKGWIDFYWKPLAAWLKKGKE